jgi:hypothetical protein
MQRIVVSTLRWLVEEESTDRQREALGAVLGGMPLQEVARCGDCHEGFEARLPALRALTPSQ